MLALLFLAAMFVPEPWVLGVDLEVAGPPAREVHLESRYPSRDECEEEALVLSLSARPGVTIVDLYCERSPGTI